MNISNKQYYSNLIFYYLIENYDLSLLFSTCTINQINNFIHRLNKDYPNLDLIIYNYIIFFDKDNNKFLSLRVIKQLLYYLITSNKLNESQLKKYILFI